MYRWCAYDSEFTPNKYDDRFKLWISKGLTDYNSFVHKGTFQSFENLKHKHGLDSTDFFRYLQIRHYFNKNIKKQQGDVGFLQTFMSIIKSISPTKIISKLYNGILGCKGGNTYYIKKKWETEGRINITEEEWDHVCEFQWTTTGSNIWREFVWKNTTRFFVTPAQKKYQGTGDACWRCNKNAANHFHIFWECAVIQEYWFDIHQHLQNIFNIIFPPSFNNLYLGGVDLQLNSNKEKKLIHILLTAAKKAITRKWLKPERPTIENWIDVVKDIFTMEKISFTLKLQLDIFYPMWSKWTEYVKPVRFDFV